MSVLILNTTGNKNDFEDEFCKRLLRGISKNSDLLNSRGMDLLDVDIKGYEVVVVVSHGISDENLYDTKINLGFDEDELGVKDGILNNPTILAQMLGKNDRKFILVYCACNGLSSQTLLSGIEMNNCIGVVASKTPIGAEYIVAVAEVINRISEFMSTNSSDIANLNRDIKLIIERYKDKPNFDTRCPHFYISTPLKVIG